MAETTFEQILTPPLPGALGIDATETPVLQALQARTQAVAYSASLINAIARYTTSFNTNFNTLQLQAEDGDEASSLAKLYDLGNTISTQVDPIINALLGVLNKSLTTQEPDIDIQSLLDKIVPVIFGYLDAEDIADARAVLRANLDLLFLDSAWNILATDITDVDAIINAFKTEAKSQLDEKMFELERRDINSLISAGLIDSTIGADTITRISKTKGRQFTEIDAKAVQLRNELLEQRFQRTVERNKGKLESQRIFASSLIQFPDSLTDLIGDLARRRFLDNNAFAQSLPNIIQSAVSSLSNVKELGQRDRFQSADVQIEVGKTIIGLFGDMINTLGSISSSAAKLATFEAS